MNVRRSFLAASALALFAVLPVGAQSPAPADAPRGHAMHRTVDPFTQRLENLLQESRDKKRRVVLFVHGDEVAGVVLELGPGWVILSNQEDQEILLRTYDVQRAEFR